MKTAFRKNVFRQIKNTWNRFIAIFGIVALGVGFFAGLKATTPVMKMSADAYYDDCGFMDLRILSTKMWTLFKIRRGLRNFMPLIPWML